MAGRDSFFSSPLRGEVGADAPGEGFSAWVGHRPFSNAEPLTPSLSPQGRGGEGAAAYAGEENSYGTA